MEADLKTLGWAAFIIIGFIIALVVGARMITSMQENQISQAPTITKYNETVTCTDMKLCPLKNGYITGISSVTNLTATVPSGYYNVSSSTNDAGYIVLRANGTSLTVNVTYLYLEQQSAYNASLAGNKAMANFSSYNEIIVLAVIITIIVSLLVGAFVFFKKD